MKKCSVTLLIVSFAITVIAPLYALEQVTLKELIGAAKEHNTAIKAARQRWNASRAMIAQEHAWDRPKLSLEYLSIPEGSSDVGAAPDRMYGISQMIPFPGKLFIKKKIANNEAEAMLWEYHELERTVLSALRSAYAMYCYTDESIETYRSSIELVRRYAAVAQSNYITGKAAQSELLRVEIEADKMAAMLSSLELEKQSIKAEINQLIGKNAESDIGKPQEIILDLKASKWEPIKEAALKNSPELGRANANIRKSEWAKRLAMMEYLPDFDISIKRKTMHGAWAGSDVMVGADIPLWFWKQRSFVSQRSEELMAAQSDKLNIELMVAAKAKDAFLKIEALKRTLELYSTSLLPKTKQLLEVSQASYAAGSMTYMELVESVRSYLDMKLEYAGYVLEYHKYNAQLESITGEEYSVGGSR